MGLPISLEAPAVLLSQYLHTAFQKWSQLLNAGFPVNSTQVEIPERILQKEHKISIRHRLSECVSVLLVIRVCISVMDAKAQPGGFCSLVTALHDPTPEWGDKRSITIHSDSTMAPVHSASIMHQVLVERFHLVTE